MWQCAMNCIMWNFIKWNCWLLFLLFMYLCVFTCICFFFSLNEFTDVLSQINCVSLILSTLSKQHFRPVHRKWISPKITEKSAVLHINIQQTQVWTSTYPIFPKKLFRIPQKLLFHMKVLKLNVIRPLECFFLPFSLSFFLKNKIISCLILQ